MSDDPFYPSPIVKSQKKYKTRAQSSNLCSTGYNQGWAQEIFKSSKSFLHTTQIEHKDLSVPLPVFRAAGQIARVHLAPSLIKYKYCKDLTV